MEMHQLRYLEAVAKCGSIMAAASNCHVSQPALSVQLKKLEEELGTALLTRNPRGVSLTVAGERALVTARRVLREVAGLRSDAKMKTFLSTSVLSVSIQPYVATEIVPKLFTNLEDESLAEGRLEFRERTPSRLIEAVANGGTDLGILDANSAGTGDLCVEEFSRVPFALFCHKDHPLAQRTRLRLVHLPAYPIILFEYCPGLRQRLHSAAIERKNDLRIPFTTELAVTAFEMLAHGMGVTVLPLSFQARAARRQIIARPIDDYEEVAKISAVWREGTELPSNALAFLERLRMSFSDTRRRRGH